MHDLVLRGGLLVDGTGAAPRRGDLAVDGDRIAALGDVPGNGWRELDVDGCLVTPGFVDPHTHLDAQLFWDPLCTPSCWHGTTSVVLGNCGVSFAPLHRGDHALLAQTLESVEEVPAASMAASLTFQWEGYGEYLDALAARALGVNAAGLVGHVALRTWAMGEAGGDPERQPDARELAAMGAALDAALAGGALGFSTSRTRSHATPAGVPIPGTFAAEPELFALAEVLRRRGRGLVQWVAGFGEEDRGGEGYPEAEREVGRIAETARRAGRPAIFSVFTHEWVPTLHRHVLARARAERAAGARLRPMMGPRLGTSLVGLASPRAPVRSRAWKALYEAPPGERLARLEDPDARAALLALRPEVDAALGERLFRFGPERCDYERREAERLDHLAAARGERPVEALVRLLRESGGRQLFAAGGANQNRAHVDEVLEDPDVILGLGDAGAHVTAICDASYTTWVMAHEVRDRGRWSVAEGVRRLTSDPADAFGLAGRGRLAVGAAADVNVIDLPHLALEVPEFVWDLPAGAGRWTQGARGYELVLVNGAVAIERDRHTGRLAGRVLRA